MKPLLTFFFCILLSISSYADPKPVIGAVEQVALKLPSGKIIFVDARIDSGAGMSSISKALVKEYGFPIDESDTVNKECPNGQAIVKSANGKECRERVQITFTLAGFTHVTNANVADRSNLSYKLLIGRKNLLPYLIEIKSEDKFEEAEEETPSN